MQNDRNYISKLVNEVYKQAGINAVYSDKRFKSGDKVKINIKQIMNRKEFYEKTSLKYQGLLTSMTGNEIFTVKSGNGLLIELEEIPVWLWWVDDLILV